MLPSWEDENNLLCSNRSSGSSYANERYDDNGANSPTSRSSHASKSSYDKNDTRNISPAPEFNSSARSHRVAIAGGGEKGADIRQEQNQQFSFSNNNIPQMQHMPTPQGNRQYYPPTQQPQQQSHQWHNMNAAPSTFADKASILNAKLFKSREAMLSVAEHVRAVTEYLRKIETYVTREADLDLKLVSPVNAYGEHAFKVSNRHFRLSLDDARNDTTLDDSLFGTSHAAGARYRAEENYDGDGAASAIRDRGILPPKEAYVLTEKYRDLQESVLGCMRAVADCFCTRKVAYANQLKKTREISNIATRNAMQNERAETAKALTRLRTAMEKSSHDLNASLEERVRIAESESSRLAVQVTDLQECVRELREKDQNRQFLQEQAVQRALLEKQVEVERQARDQSLLIVKENRRLNEEALFQLENANKQFVEKLDAQQRHDGEIRAMLSADRGRLEAECTKLREDLLHARAQVAGEKERCAARLQEQRERGEREQQLAHAQALKAQAELQAEMATLLKRVKEEEIKRDSNLEVRVAKYKQAVLSDHAQKLHQLADRHRAEIKRMQAEYRVKHQDDITKIRHLHAQEMNRVIRDNERLYRAASRVGGSLFGGDLGQQQSRSRSRSPFAETVYNRSFDSPWRPPGSTTTKNNNNKTNNNNHTTTTSNNRSNRTEKSSNKKTDDGKEKGAGRTAKTGTAGSGSGFSPLRTSLSPGRRTRSAGITAAARDEEERFASYRRRGEEEEEDDVEGSSGTVRSSYFERVGENKEGSKVGNTVGNRGREGLNWGSLRESLTQQEQEHELENSGVFYPSRLPPDSFPLDHARTYHLSATVSDSVSQPQGTTAEERHEKGKEVENSPIYGYSSARANLRGMERDEEAHVAQYNPSELQDSGFGVTENARSVGLYMSKLEDYLKSDSQEEREEEDDGEEEEGTEDDSLDLEQSELEHLVSLPKRTTSTSASFPAASSASSAFYLSPSLQRAERGRSRDGAGEARSGGGGTKNGMGTFLRGSANPSSAAAGEGDFIGKRYEAAGEDKGHGEQEEEEEKESRARNDGDARDSRDVSGRSSIGGGEANNSSNGSNSSGSLAAAVNRVLLLNRTTEEEEDRDNIGSHEGVQEQQGFGVNGVTGGRRQQGGHGRQGERRREEKGEMGERQSEQQSVQQSEHQIEGEEEENDSSSDTLFGENIILNLSR